MELSNRPLAAHRLAESRDAEIVRSAVGSVFCDYHLGRLRGDSAFNAHFHGLQLNSGGIYYLEYGTDVQIEPHEVEDFYLVQVPLKGQARVSLGSETFVSTPERASLLQPGRRASMMVDQFAGHLILRLNQTMVLDALRKKLDRKPTTPLVFDPQIDLTTPSNQVFLNLLLLLVHSIDAVTTPSSLAVREFEALLISQLILGQPSNYCDELHRGQLPGTARPIVRAAELIEAHAHEPLTVDDIAVAVGITARALQDGFRRSYDTTPMAFLRDVRMQRVRTDLMDADPTRTTVTAVALKWGFLHLGRFSVLYHRRFGETPSQTLRLTADHASRTLPN